MVCVEVLTQFWCPLSLELLGLCGDSHGIDLDVDLWDVIVTFETPLNSTNDRTKSGTSVTGITVVTDRPARDKDGKTYKDENGYTAKDSEFHRVTCFNGLAKTVGQYCSKGQLVSVQGRLHYTQWDDQDGVKRYGCEILADKVDFLSRGNSQSGESGGESDNRDAPEID